LAAIFPDVVYQNADGYYEVDFGALNFYTLKAVVEIANIVSANGDADLNNVSTGGTLRLTSAGALQNITGLTVTSGGATISGGLTATGTINLNAGALLSDTNINTGVSTGTVTIGGGTAALVINSSAFDVTSAGAVSGVTTLNMSGLATIGGGATVSGGTINLNAGGLLTNTNINTGVSTGTVTIGGGTAALVINSTAFDVTSSGAVSGVTTLNASGNITITGATSDYQIVRGVTTYAGADLACGNNQYVNSAVFRGGIITSYSACSGVGLSDARLKDNVVDLNSTLDRIKDIRTVTFDFKCDDPAFVTMNESCNEGTQTGVIAQELAQVFPELVYQDDYGYYRVKYDALGIYALKATGEIAQHIDSQGNIAATTVSTNDTVRLNQSGQLQNITGLNMISGGASVVGGLNNNNGGITNTGEISGATTIAAESIKLAANSTDNILELTKDGNGVFTVFNDGALLIKLDSSNAFAVKDSTGIGIFNIDSQTGKISVGSGNTNKTVLFVLDNRTLPDDPPGTPGGSYYNTVMQRFRCYEGTRWQDCLPAGDLTDPFVLSKVTWALPAADTEFPDTPRIVSNLYRAHEYRLRMRTNTSAPAGSSCRIQYAQQDSGPWNDVTDGSTGELAVDQTGTLRTDWLKLTEPARNENMILRVMCKGGNGSQVVVFSGVSMQLR
jgi:hypothetical protein